MRIRAVIPYLIYACCYFVLALLSLFVLDDLPAGRYTDIIGYLVLVPLSLLVARRFGRLSYQGLFSISLLMIVLECFLIFVVLNAIAVSDGSPTSLEQRFINIVQMLSWRFAILTLLSLIFPIAWLFVLKHFYQPATRPG